MSAGSLPMVGHTAIIYNLPSFFAIRLKTVGARTLYIKLTSNKYNFYRTYGAFLYTISYQGFTPLPVIYRLYEAWNFIGHQ